MTTFDDLKLYVLPGCPYCAKVDAFLEKNDAQIEHLDVTQGSNGDDLVRIGGKRQCPCLLIDGKPMYESGDIINYLAGRLGTDASGEEVAKGGACRFVPGGGHVCD